MPLHLFHFLGSCSNRHFRDSFSTVANPSQLQFLQYTVQSSFTSSLRFDLFDDSHRTQMRSFHVTPSPFSHPKTFGFETGIGSCCYLLPLICQGVRRATTWGVLTTRLEQGVIPSALVFNPTTSLGLWCPSPGAGEAGMQCASAHWQAVSGVVSHGQLCICKEPISPLGDHLLPSTPGLSPLPAPFLEGCYLVSLG